MYNDGRVDDNVNNAHAALRENEVTQQAGEISRRRFIGILGAGSLAVIAGCESQASAPMTKGTPENMGGGVATTNITPVVPGAGAEAEPAVPPVMPTKPYTPPVAKNSPATNPADGIIRREVWALGGPNLRTVDPMNGVRWITFHHSGDPKPFYENDFWETAKHIEGVREYHRSRGFQDIGYHFAIDRAGRVWQLRNLKYQGQHVRTDHSRGIIWNEHNIGVVVLGNFDKQSMTTAQKEKVKTFAGLLRKEYKLPVSRLKTHQELVETECPGRAMQPFMVEIRRRGLV